MNSKVRYTLVAIVVLAFLFIGSCLNSRQRAETNEDIELRNGLVVKDLCIVKTGGIHTILEPNSVLLSDSYRHGYRIEIHYPEIEDEKDVAIVKKINEQLDRLFRENANNTYEHPDGGCEIHVWYETAVVSNVLVFTKITSSYICGATVESIRRITYHFKLETGELIDIKALISKDRSWKDKLTRLIKHKMDEDGRFYDADAEFIDNIGDIRLCEDGIEVWYVQYDGPTGGGGPLCVEVPYNCLRIY